MGAWPSSPSLVRTPVLVGGACRVCLSQNIAQPWCLEMSEIYSHNSGAGSPALPEAPGTVSQRLCHASPCPLFTGASSCVPLMRTPVSFASRAHPQVAAQVSLGAAYSPPREVMWVVQQGPS